MHMHQIGFWEQFQGKLRFNKPNSAAVHRNDGTGVQERMMLSAPTRSWPTVQYALHLGDFEKNKKEDRRGEILQAKKGETNQSLEGFFPCLFIGFKITAQAALVTISRTIVGPSSLKTLEPAAPAWLLASPVARVNAWGPTRTSTRRSRLRRRTGVCTTGGGRVPTALTRLSPLSRQS